MSHTRKRLIVAAAVTLAAAVACQKREAPSAAAAARDQVVAQAEPGKPAEPKPLTAARTRADAARKVIYKAELTVEVRSPSDAQAKVTALVEREGGWVASAARETATEQASDVTLVVRVPAERFSAVLTELRRLGDGKRSERIDSEDVTDEVVDLDARLRVQTRLEEQLLELLKTATTVDAALHVHKELATVRTEIERIQGRKQLLERDVAMSTIRLTLNAPPVDSVKVSMFGRSVSDAASDAVLVAGGIVVGAIRLTGVLVPIAAMLGLPLLAVALLVRRRARRR